MSDSSVMPRDTAADAQATLEEWVDLSEALSRGLVHALNNRLTALLAFSELAAMGEEEFSTRHTMPAELARLQQVSGLFRLLAMEHGPAEALELCALIDEASALHVHHVRVRPVRCDIVRDASHVAVRAPRRALLRLMLVLMERGKRAAERRGREVVTVRVGCTEPWVTVHVDGASHSPALHTLAAQCDAVTDQAGDGVIIRLPSLQTLRRREQSAPDASEN